MCENTFSPNLDNDLLSKALKLIDSGIEDALILRRTKIK